jgi:hypothetical protein
MAEEIKMICRKDDDSVVCEIFPVSFHRLKHLNTDKYYAVDAKEHLEKLNKKIKEC